MAVKTKHLVSGYRVPGEPISLDEMKTFLWGAATRLRGQIDAAGYKEYIFPLLFFKRISDVYDEQYNGFLREGGEEYAGMQVEDLAIKIPQGAHWDDVREVTENVGQKLVEAFIAIEQANPGEEVDGRVVGGLEGIFGPKDGWTNKSKMPDSIIISLIEDFSRYNLSLESCPADEMGQAYEYLVGKFADDAGNTAQEFYTNRTVVTLMAEILQPKPDESIYDPTCGSGGMLIKCLNYLRDKGQPWQGVKVFGQEINALTASIARMNLYLNGVEDFSIVREDTLSHPAFVDGSRLRKFDIVLANPPYSIKQWNREAFAHDYWGRNMFGTPPQGRADYAFIQHIIASMDERAGRCAILLPHGVLNRIDELQMRSNLVEADLVDCVISIGKNLFFNSPMEACIMICRSKKPEERKGSILFIRATDLVERKNTESYLTSDHIHQIVNLYNAHSFIEGRSKVLTIPEIRENEYSLSPKLYVPAKASDETDESVEDLVTSWDISATNALKEFNSLSGMLV
jgi:type I restriction enzyme M protein